MMSLNTRFKSAVLVVAMLATSHVAAFSVSAAFTPKKVAVFALVAMWIRLRTKGSNFDYKMSDWADDVKEVMEEYNIWDKELYEQLLALFDKYVVGRQVSIIDVTYRTKNEDGTIVTLKDKKLKCKPFGLMGYFDAYVIMQLEKVGEIAKNWDSTNKLFAKFDGTPKGDNRNLKVTVELVE